MLAGHGLGAGFMFDANDATKLQCRRVEVLTGPERRHRWSPEDKASIMAEAFAPDTNASATARRWQICPQQVYAWRREARAGLLPMSAEMSVSPAFVQIISEPAGRIRSMRATSCAFTVEIELAGAVLRVPGGNPDLLASVLRAVRASASVP